MNWSIRINSIGSILLLFVITLLAGCQAEPTALDKVQNHLDASHWKLALDACEKELKSSPDSSQLYLLRGQAYLGLQQEFMAINDFTRVIKVDPHSHQAYWYRAEAYQRLHKTKLAEQDRHYARIYHPEYYLTQGSSGNYNYVDTSEESESRQRSNSKELTSESTSETESPESKKALIANISPEQKKFNDSLTDPYRIKSLSTDDKLSNQKKKSPTKNPLTLLDPLSKNKLYNPLKTNPLFPEFDTGQKKQADGLSKNTPAHQFGQRMNFNQAGLTPPPRALSDSQTKRTKSRNSSRNRLTRGLTYPTTGTANKHQAHQSKSSQSLHRWSSPAMKRFNSQQQNHRSTLLPNRTGHSQLLPNGATTRPSLNRGNSSIAKPTTILPSLRSGTNLPNSNLP